MDQKLLKEIIPSFFTTRRNFNQDFYSASVFEAKSLETLNLEERMFSGDQNLLEKVRSKIRFFGPFLTVKTSRLEFPRFRENLESEEEFLGKKHFLK